MNNPVMEILRQEIDQLKKNLEEKTKHCDHWEDLAFQLQDKFSTLSPKMTKLELENRELRTLNTKLENLLQGRERKEELADRIVGLQEAMRPLLEEWSKL